MGRRIYEGLRPVRSRLAAVALIKAVLAGVLASSAAVAALALYRWWTASALSPWAVAAAASSGPILGLLVGTLRWRSWEAAARAVDSHYGLKDRASTALSFLRAKSPTAWHELQLADAAEHLASVEPRVVVPFRVPRLAPIALGALAASLALMFLPLSGRKAQAGPTPPRPEIVEVHDRIVEDLKQLDELAKQEQDKDLDALLKELKQKAEELKQPGVDAKEALAKLSEMQAAMAAQQAQYNTGLVDGQLQSLGEALMAADSTEAAGSALQDSKFDQAAKELEKLEDPDLAPKEAKGLEEKLKQVAKAMGDAGLGQMGEMVGEVAEGIKGGDRTRISKGTKGLAAAARKHAKRRRINRILDAEFEELNECKGLCQNNGGPKVQVKKKSVSPSNSWGRGVAGNTEGEKTSLLAKRDVKEITGQMGDEGDSEMETTHSPEGRQQAARGYREAYKKAVKQSEAVLDGEPIPLGHRQTIRRYFELIRPANDEEAGPEAKAKPGE